MKQVPQEEYVKSNNTKISYYIDKEGNPVELEFKNQKYNIFGDWFDISFGRDAFWKNID